MSAPAYVNGCEVFYATASQLPASGTYKTFMTLSHKKAAIIRCHCGCTTEVYGITPNGFSETEHICTTCSDSYGVKLEGWTP